MITAMHNTTGGKSKINVYADIVLNHQMANHDWDQGINNLEANPAVKGYVFDEAFRSGTQYVPYPTNEIAWVIPNAGTGDYYIKIKGYNLDYVASYKERAYDVEIDWTGAGSGSLYGWESEPNNGGGQTDDFGASGTKMRGFIGYNGDIDEYKITLSSSHDIVIKLFARSQVDNGDWNWANQENGYYPIEIWHNGQNLAATSLQAQTYTNINYVTHTGTGEPNYTWDYTNYHPVDQYDFLTGWDSNGGNSAIIPNTKGFGHDLNSYSTTVQNRMNDWGVWLSNQIHFDGYRLDFVRGFQVNYAASWINNLPLLDGSQRFIVGEYWGPDIRLNDWVNDLNTLGADADVFDFPLRDELKRLCTEDAFQINGLNHAGMVRNAVGHALPGTSVVTWVDNHDTGKEWDKWVTKDWMLGYAYILTHEGRPCIFYPHYYGAILESEHNGEHHTLTIPSNKAAMDDLIFIRKTYLGGGLQVLTEVGNPWPSSNTTDVYVARRQGNGIKDGAIVVINNGFTTKGVWVDATPTGYANWSSSSLKNAFTAATTTVHADGRVWLEAPARGYAVYVQSSDYVPLSLKSETVLKGEIKPEMPVEINAYPNPFKEYTKITFATMQKGDLSVKIIDSSGKNFAIIHEGFKESGNHEFNWDSKGVPVGLYFVKIKGNGIENTIKIIKAK